MTPAGLAPAAAAGGRWDVSPPAPARVPVRLPGRVDAWLAAAVAVASAAVVVASPAGAPYRGPDAVAVGLAVAAAATLLWRSLAPLPALVVAGLTVVVNAAAGYAIGPLEWPAWILLFSCFAVGGARLRAAAAAVAVLAVAGYELADHGDPGRHLPAIAVSFLVATVAGDLSNRRARETAAHALRATEHREQAMAAERLLLQERARLARELHDALGHAVNVMVLQAGIGRRLFTENPAYAREALGSVETVGRGALQELDRLLRVLQPDERGSDRHAVPPGLADLEDLAGRIRATGRQVDLHADDVRVGPSTARAIYRIAQEALTNAVRHTSAGRIRIDLAQDGERVVLDVLNEGQGFAPPVPGRGMVNMRERARLEGGDLEAGPVAGGFRIRAVLPAEVRVPS